MDFGHAIRKTRTLKVTEVRVSEEHRQMLAALHKDARYEALLDLMERACISIDTALINAPIGNPEEILGAHAVSKSAWLFFTYVQKQVLNAYIAQTMEPGEGQPASLEEMVQSVEGLPFQGEEAENGPNLG